MPTELVAFRQRISEPGMELILRESIRVNDPPDKPGGAVVSVDTTVQEKNITHPTDDKQYKKIIKKCWKIAEKEGIDLRQSYTRTFKKLGHQQRFKNTKNGAERARKASKRIKTSWQAGSGVGTQAAPCEARQPSTSLKTVPPGAVPKTGRQR